MPTVLSFGDGMLMADDLIDWSDLDSGITWTRGAWTRGDRNLMELRPEPTVVVDPEQYAHMELMTFDGALVAMKTAGGMVSGGGTVSDGSDADDAATESEPLPSQDAATDDAATAAAGDLEPGGSETESAKIDSGSGFDGASAKDLGETAEDSDAEPDDNDEEGGDDGDDYEEDDSMFADLF